MDIHYVAGEDFWVVLVTPPGSEALIIIGNGITGRSPAEATEAAALYMEGVR